MAKKTEKAAEPKKAKAKAKSSKPEKAAKPAKAAAKKAAPAKKAESVKTDAKQAAPRHPRARVIARHGGKEQLAKSLADALARDDEDTDLLAARLKKSSNAQLLRLHHVSETVKAKFGDRGKLIAAIGAAQKKAGDKDYLAMLDTLSLPHLLDLAIASQRAANV